MAWVPSGMASGQDITTHTSPMPVPWVVRVFSHTLMIVTFTPLPNKIVDCFQIAPHGSLSDWPLLSTWTMPLATFQVSAFSGSLSRFKLAVVDNMDNAFGCLSSFSLFFMATSSQQL
jgi:hypothetical protein